MQAWKKKEKLKIQASDEISIYKKNQAAEKAKIWNFGTQKNANTNKGEKTYFAWDSILKERTNMIFFFQTSLNRQ